MNTNSYIMRISIQIIRINKMNESNTLFDFAISIQILIIFAKLIQIFQSDDILMERRENASQIQAAC